MAHTVPVEALEVAAYTVPTEGPESDGTLEWDATTMVVVEVGAGGKTGLGWTYEDLSAATLIAATLRPHVLGSDALAPTATWGRLNALVRNTGLSGVAGCAISAVDTALWDLKARLLGLPLVTLLGQVRPAIPVYGSGGFTSYSVPRLQSQLAGWVEQGLTRVKMKVGREPERDVARVAAAREAIGEAELFVDANGAYGRKRALAFAEAFAEHGVSWFEEPVSSDDLEGLRLLRDRAPAGMAITAGEYGYELFSFRRMVEAGAVDVLMPDVTRCGGFTGVALVDALCRAHTLPTSSHCAPALTLHAACALPSMRHMEHFFDHVRIEHMLLDGVPDPDRGALAPDLSRPGHGLELRRADAERYRRKDG